MIVSHRHGYVFIELPHTGSTAVSRELRAHYFGEKILGKHSPYRDFLRIATERERRYFAFSAVRNPLDVTVTKYLKYATDHLGRYTDPVKVARNRGLGNAFDRFIQRMVVQRGVDFSSFFLAVYRFPFNTWACLDHKSLDYVMRFENLQDDFSHALSLLGIEQTRPLPVVNPTAAKKASFDTYYSKDARDRAKKVFAGYMNEWGYTFPEGWGQPQLSQWDRLRYDLSTGIMKLYWKYAKRLMWKKDWSAGSINR